MTNTYVKHAWGVPPENCHYIRLDLDEISKLTEQGVITLAQIS